MKVARDIKPGFNITRRPLRATNQEMLGFVDKCLVALATTTVHRFTDKRVLCSVTQHRHVNDHITISLYIARDGLVDQVKWEMFYSRYWAPERISASLEFYTGNLRCMDVEELPRKAAREMGFSLKNGFDQQVVLGALVNVLMVFFNTQNVEYVIDSPKHGFFNTRN